jgi:hypothetical protein
VGLDAGKAYRLRYTIGNADEGVVSKASDILKKATGNGLTPLKEAEGGTTSGTFDFWGDLTLRSNSAVFASTSGTSTLSDFSDKRTKTASANNTTTGEAEYIIANVGNIGTMGKAYFKMEYVPFGKLEGSAWTANSADFHTGVNPTALPVWVIRNGLNDMDGAIDFAVVPAGGVEAQDWGIYEDNNPIPIAVGMTGTSENDMTTALSALNAKGATAGYGTYTVKLEVEPSYPKLITLGGAASGVPPNAYPNIKSEHLVIDGPAAGIKLPKVEKLWTPGSNVVSYGPNVFPQVFTVKSVATGYYHSLVLMTDGSVWATGKNSDGQLGTNNNENKSIFTKVLDTGSGAVGVASRNCHSLVVKEDGSVWATGINYDGLLGNTQDKKIFTEVEIP